MRRALPFLVAVVLLTVALVAVGCGGGTPQLRFDGVYESEEIKLLSDEQHSYQVYLRFYEDGTALVARYANADPSVVLGWMTKENLGVEKYAGLTQGNYEFKDGQLKFSTAGSGNDAYSLQGTVEGEMLTVSYAWEESGVPRVGSIAFHFKK